MDALSETLKIVRLSGGVFLHGEFTHPWCLRSEVTAGDCSPVLDANAHIVLYHFVVEGHFAVRVGAEPTVVIGPGESVLFPHNDTHLFGSDLGLPPVGARSVVQPSAAEGLDAIRHGGGGETTRIVCGYLGCEPLRGNPLIDALPPLLRFDSRRGSAAEWMRSTFQFAADEIASGRVGTDIVLARLSEVLFVEAVRQHVESLGDDEVGWLAGLRDRFVSRALGLLHREPFRAWTVDALSREVGLSRSALSERFTRLLGEPPMRYLSRWRMQVAAHRLRSTSLTVMQVAESVGYETEAAFSRAFKRTFGEPPSRWRRRPAAPGRPSV